jgi:hypothetical protein
MPRQGSSVLVPQDSLVATEVGGSSQPVLGWQSAHSTLASLAQRSSHWVLQQKGSTWQTDAWQAGSAQPVPACGEQQADWAWANRRQMVRVARQGTNFRWGMVVLLLNWRAVQRDALRRQSAGSLPFFLQIPIVNRMSPWVAPA